MEKVKPVDKYSSEFKILFSRMMLSAVEEKNKVPQSGQRTQGSHAPVFGKKEFDIIFLYHCSICASMCRDKIVLSRTRSGKRKYKL